MLHAIEEVRLDDVSLLLQGDRVHAVEQGRVEDGKVTLKAFVRIPRVLIDSEQAVFGFEGLGDT